MDKIFKSDFYQQKFLKNLIFIILFFYAVTAALTIIFFNGTGDAGDSIYHYLFAKYAPTHPELFFDSWAKPLYVLLACPFAQFGFTGVKVFNAVVSLATILFTYKIACGLTIKNDVLVAIIMIFTPLYYILTFSGLTEPLFALVIAVCIYFAIKQQYITSCLILSFILFVRSEGLIIIGVFGIYFLLKKEYRLIPYLLFGSVVYSIAGYFVYHDLLWVFNTIPYANLSSPYGSGKLFHFVEQLFYVVGFPIYFLFWTGILSTIWKTIKKKIGKEEEILIFLGFVCFFVAHSLFWYFGIFNSMGLKRILIGVMPMISVISLHGFNLITEAIPGRKRILKIVVQGLFLAYILIFPFTLNPAAIDWKKDMMLNKDQQSAIRAADFIVHKTGNNSHILCAHPYLYEVLNIDCFDKDQSSHLTQRNISQMKAGDIIIWENWFALTESKIKKESLDTNQDLINLYTSKVDDEGHEIIYSIYKKNDSIVK